MADGDVSARDRDVARADAAPLTIAGQAAIRDLLAADSRRHRSPAARAVGRSPLTASGRARYRAAMSEVEVGEALDAVGGEWRVLHSVALDADGSTIDHLVVGPAGVYIVATAVHVGRVVVAAQRTFTASDVRYPHIRNLELEMGRAERLLSAATGLEVEVCGVLAVVEPKSLEVREEHRDVAVLVSTSVARWLSGRPAVLSAADVVAIADAARLPSTWGVDLVVAEDPLVLAEEFASVRAEVTHAWSLRRWWTSAITVVGAAAFVFVAYSIVVAALATKA